MFTVMPRMILTKLSVKHGVQAFKLLWGLAASKRFHSEQYRFANQEKLGN